MKISGFVWKLVAMFVINIWLSTIFTTPRPLEHHFIQGVLVAAFVNVIWWVFDLNGRLFNKKPRTEPDDELTEKPKRKTAVTFAELMNEKPKRGEKRKRDTLDEDKFAELQARIIKKYGDPIDKE